MILDDYINDLGARYALRHGVVDGPALHGHAGLVHLFGIESPGLTSSLAIADFVADQIDA